MEKNINISNISDAVFKDVFNKHKDLLIAYVNKICNVNLKPENTYTAEIEEKENPRVRGVRFDVRYDSIDSNTIYRINFEAQRRIYKNVNFNTRKFLYATKLY